MIKRLVNLSFLPSKGKVYPKDIEIYVEPVSMKEEFSMARTGLTKAEYYENILKNIEIKGIFDKDNLLYGDLQMIDLVRRLYTFEEDEKIVIEGQLCGFCKKDVKPSFLQRDITFTDLDEDIFGKEFTFTDGLTITVSPIEARPFINLCRKHLSNLVIEDGKENTLDLSDFVLDYYAELVTSVKDRFFVS